MYLHLEGDVMTQNQALLSALKKGPVTFLHAYLKLGIGCPTSRIAELRKKHKIETVPVKVKTRWGKTVIAKWVLVK